LKHATLVFGRVKFEAVKIASNGKTRFLDVTDARAEYERGPGAEAAAHAVAVKAVHEQRKAFVASATVKPGITVKRDTGGLRKASVIVDQVSVGGLVREVPPGEAQKFLQDEATRRFPTPSPPGHSSFEAWFQDNKKTVRTWRAQFISDAAVRECELPPDLNWDWGFPIAVAMSELNRVAEDGWTLVHVSEDHGLYAGADAMDESYPVRVRYLLQAK
jgi:hypothetical protein